MKRFHLPCIVGLLLVVASPATAQRYAATRDGEVVQLTDTATNTRVSIAPSVGNIAFKMTVMGHDVLRWPHADMAAFRARVSRAGFAIDAVHGDYRGGPWTPESDAWVVIGKKR